MTAGAALVALLALVLTLAGLAELVRGRTQVDSRARGDSPRESGPTRIESVPAAAIAFGLPDRIRRAGRDGVVSPRSVLAAKAVFAAFGLASGLAIAPLFSGRAGPLVVAGLAAGGFLLPDFLLERAARRRHRRMINSLPDVLDLMAVSVATGRSLGGSLADLSKTGRGPLVEELGEVGRDLAWGKGQAAALASLRARVGGAEIAALCSALERSRKLGSPLAEQLRRQSGELRRNQGRAVEEEAARAAPKIQLVVALLLVPSVLLLIVAALVANSDALLGPAF